MEDLHLLIAVLGSPVFISLIDKIIKLFNFTKQRKNGGTVCQRLEKIEKQLQDISNRMD